MSFLFSRSKQKSPQELVKLLSELLSRAERTEGSTDRRKADDLARVLYQMKVILYGDQETDPIPDQIGVLAQEVYATDVLVPLVANLHLLEFDSRKDVVIIFTTLLRRQIGSRSPTVDYLASRPAIFESLISWSASPDLGITANAILRDCIKYEQLAKNILNSPLFWNYLDYVDSDHFETASDAFTTVHELFTANPQVVAVFLGRNSGPFAIKMTALMGSSNYVTKRQSVKIMSHVLRQRANYVFMTEYIMVPEHLKQVMILLRDKSKNVQYEAFQIFKLFAANPKKPKPIIDILAKNKNKLISFLTNFSTEKKDDHSFKDEKDFLIKQISLLPDPQASTPSPQLISSSILSPPSGSLPQVHSETVHSPPPSTNSTVVNSSNNSSIDSSPSDSQYYSHPLPKVPGTTQ
ncbi:hypothetical protein TRVA0_003S01112 [Trichomonascus vanleenenianus]|uniref:Hym1p n=1 Tax=Trichomonascus vanleenenianus TaxID=2268995 RepID=UPI003EC976FC